MDLIKLAVEERLPSPTRIDGHNLDQIDHVQHLLQHVQRRAWIDADADLDTELSDGLEQAMEVWGRLLMHDQPIGPSLGKGLDLASRVRDHEMDVKRQLDLGPKCPDNPRAERDVRHELPVHHVNLDGVDAGPFCLLSLLSQGCKIRGKDRSLNRNHSPLLTLECLSAGSGIRPKLRLLGQVSGGDRPPAGSATADQATVYSGITPQSARDGFSRC